MTSTARIESILMGVNEIGDRDYLLVLKFNDHQGQNAVGLYRYEKKATFQIGQELDIHYANMTDKNRKRLQKKYKDVNAYAADCTMYDAEPVDAEQYVDPNAITFTKNQYPGDQTTLLYVGMVGLAVLLVLLVSFGVIG